MNLWLGMESYLLNNAADNGRRLVVFTGPIFSDPDPVYRDVQIPLKFFKVAAFMHGGSLAATGYVVDQTRQLADSRMYRALEHSTTLSHCVRSEHSKYPSGTSHC